MRYEVQFRTSELTGAALDWAVAKCESALGHYVQPNEKRGTSKWGITTSTRRYSTNWVQGGPIIEREGLTLTHQDIWVAQTDDDLFAYGPTPLIAAMRCYVVSKMGDVVEIPEELTK